MVVDFHQLPPRLVRFWSNLKGDDAIVDVDWSLDASRLLALHHSVCIFLKLLILTTDLSFFRACIMVQLG